MSTTGQWEALFGGDRKWRIAEEVSGEVTVPAVKGQQEIAVKFDRGRFTITAPGAFRSPLSTNLGRRGVLLQETNPTGDVDIPGSRMPVGDPALRRASKEFEAVW